MVSFFSGRLVCQFPTHERFSSSYSIELFLAEKSLFSDFLILEPRILGG